MTDKISNYLNRFVWRINATDNIYQPI